MSIASEVYVDRLRYFFANLESFDLDPIEINILALLIIYEERDIEIGYDMIAKSLHLSGDDIDRAIRDLTDKELIKIKFQDRIKFDLSALFAIEKNETDDETYKQMISTFEDVFNRALSASELQILSEILSDYDKDKVLWALREAEVYQKGDPNIFYVKSVLDNDHEKSR